MNTIRVSRVDATDFEPFETPNGAEGEVHWIRTTASDGVDTQTGIWRGDESTMPDDLDVVFSGAESILVLEGELHVIDRASGVRHVLDVGSIASFDRGTPTVWHRASPVVKTLMFIAN